MRIGRPHIGEIVDRHRKATLLAAGLLSLAGVDFVLFPPKGQVLEWFALPFLAAGLALLALAAKRPMSGPAAGPPSLAARLIDRLTWERRLVPWLPALGIGLLLADLAYNAYLSASPQLGSEDTFTLLFGATLIAYPYVPAAYRREGDFALASMTVLMAILVVPLLIARAVSRNWEYSVDLYSWAALAYQVASLLAVVGVPSTVHAVPGSTAPGLTFVSNSGTEITVVITTACSGLYSFGLFVAAFFAYVLTQFRRLTWQVWAFLALGAVASYFANVLRMTVIVLAGVYGNSPQESVQNLLIAHSYAGWLIFLGWIGLFWAVLARFLHPGTQLAGSSAAGGYGPLATGPPRRRGVPCEICTEVLTPARPGYRCECGTFYHVACASTEAECPRCRRPIPRHDAPAPLEA